MDRVLNYSPERLLQVVPGVEEEFLYQDNPSQRVPQAEPRSRENLSREPLGIQELSIPRETFSFREGDQDLETTNRYAVVIQEVPHVAEIVK